tara:strand:- start:11 stop:424 length:414 start_codon:yes stop_codon:yes gene_type:complete
MRDHLLDTYLVPKVVIFIFHGCAQNFLGLLSVLASVMTWLNYAKIAYINIIWKPIIMVNRGGIRVGSGRPAGSKNRATADIKEGLSGLTKNHTVETLSVIVELIHNSMSDNGRLAAACYLHDRGYGKLLITQIDNWL